MNIGKARALFEQIAGREYRGSTVGEYLEAVGIILNMETHNSISKKMIISVCKWLVDVAEELVSTHRWIPCSERMPDDNTDVLLQFKNNMGVGFYEDGDWAINTGDGIYSMIGDNEEKPIAWMPLPEPYREEK